MANFSFLTKKQLPDVQNGHVFECCNFMQKIPHTPIYQGKTGLVFRNCNLNNCDIPADAVNDGSGHSQISYCSNLHPDWGLPVCPVECEHLVDTDVVTIDSVVVNTIRHYEDRSV